MTSVYHRLAEVLEGRKCKSTSSFSYNLSEFLTILFNYPLLSPETAFHPRPDEL